MYLTWLQFILIWGGTSLVSFVFNIIHSFRMVKDVADLGYKINNKNLNNMQKQINPNINKINFLSMLLPFYNFFVVAKSAYDYYKFKDLLLTQLKVFGVLEEMSPLEKEIYMKKPTAFNAFACEYKAESRISKSSRMRVNEGDLLGTIFFKVEEGTGDIIIYKTTGTVSSLPVYEQKLMVKKYLDDMVKRISKIYGLDDSNKDDELEEEECFEDEDEEVEEYHPEELNNKKIKKRILGRRKK